MIELDILKKWALYSPQAIAIKDGESGAEYNYQDFYRYAQAGAAFLQTEHGIKAGDRVAVLSTNELEYVFLFYATQRLGAILVPINFRLTGPEVEHILQDCEPKLLVIHRDFASLTENLAAKNFTQRTLFLKDHADSFSEKLKSYVSHNVSFQGTMESPCMIIYTSGTTGAPKGALLSQKMLFWNSLNTTLRLNISQDDCTIIFLPFFHTGGWNVLTTPFLHRGAKLVFLKKFDADKILRLCDQEKATLLFGVPTTMDMMSQSSLFNSVDLSAIRYAIVGGEPMSLESIKTWHKRGIAIRQGYGLTEFGPNVFSLNEQDCIRKIGSIGFPNFYIEAKVVDESGNECATNQIGELVLRGPVCMEGYWRNPKATSETIKDEWLHTGDLVRKDEEGYFYVVGRKKDMYKSGGENVYPAEVEQVLRSYPGVKEAAVIGVKDEKWGEVGHAFLVMEDSQLSQDFIVAECQKRLAKFKIPKYFSLLNSLPKSDSGKVLKRKLEERLQDHVNL